MKNKECIMKFDRVSKAYRRARTAVQAVSFEIKENSVTGIIGESGSGKSTILRLAAGFEKPESGQIYLNSHPLRGRDRVKQTCSSVQMIFQNPLSSFNPRKKMRKSIEEHMAILQPAVGKIEQLRLIDELLEMVGIEIPLAERYPDEVSGGQCQRIAIARALVVRPRLLLCDEITSNLDVMTQGTIINVLRDVCRHYQTAVLFVTHDIMLAGDLCDELIVMKDGQCIEYGTAAQIMQQPRQLYTKKLLSSSRSLSAGVPLGSCENLINIS